MGRRHVTVLAVALAAGGGVTGLAADLNVVPGSLGFGDAQADRCLTGTLLVTPVLTASTVSSVTIATVPVGCAGATVSVTVDNGTTNSGGSAVVPGGGGSMTVAIAVPQTLDAAIQTEIVVVGP